MNYLRRVSMPDARNANPESKLDQDHPPDRRTFLEGAAAAAALSTIPRWAQGNPGGFFGHSGGNRKAPGGALEPLATLDSPALHRRRESRHERRLRADDATAPRSGLQRRQKNAHRRPARRFRHP